MKLDILKLDNIYTRKGTYYYDNIMYRNTVYRPWNKFVYGKTANSIQSLSYYAELVRKLIPNIVKDIGLV